MAGISGIFPEAGATVERTGSVLAGMSVTDVDYTVCPMDQQPSNDSPPTTGKQTRQGHGWAA